MNWYVMMKLSSIKGPSLARYWRGISPTTGKKTYRYGKGFYFTGDKTYSKEYGQPHEVPPEALPKNPLILQDDNDWERWLIEQYTKMGMKSIREFNQKYPDPSVYVRSLGFDGVQAGKGRQSIFCNYNPPPMEIVGGRYVLK